jgi:hypothetical protein
MKFLAIMSEHHPTGYLVWAGLAYGLTKAIVDTAAWFGLRIAGIMQGVLFGGMVVVAAALLVHLHDISEEAWKRTHTQY